MIRIGSANDLAMIAAFDPFFGNRADELAAGQVLVTESDGEVVAFTTFSLAGFIGRPFVHFLAVRASHRRRGIAVALLKAVEVKIGKGRLFISTEESNAVMRQLLAKHGWTEAGTVQRVNQDDSPECFLYREIGS